MPFIVQIPKKVERKLSLLPNSVIDKILPHLKILLSNPFPQNSKKLHNRDGYRLELVIIESSMKLILQKK